MGGLTSEVLLYIYIYQAYLQQYGEESEEDDEDGDDMCHVGNGFYLYKDLYEKLYAHQREGILWLWKLHKAKKGGILGDDMGYSINTCYI